MSTKNLRILLVEDNAADVRLTQEALRDSRLGATMNVARDGVEAIDYLRRSVADAASGEAAAAGHAAPAAAKTEFPDLVLLDLNLPRKNGREVLREIKADRRLSLIPVVVLSTSASASDVAACYELHANAYVTKPRDFDEFEATVARIGEFWGGVAARPRVAAHLT
jgi:CheY-like chemotaxis protein